MMLYLETGWSYHIRLRYLFLYSYWRHKFLCNKLVSHVNHKKVGISWFSLIRMSLAKFPKLEMSFQNYYIEIVTIFIQLLNLIYIGCIEYKKSWIAQIIIESLIIKNVTQFTWGCQEPWNASAIEVDLKRTTDGSDSRALYPNREVVRLIVRACNRTLYINKTKTVLKVSAANSLP